jgi:ADP-ribose pyrophosphatase YjhB (NUDIX family)
MSQAPERRQVTRIGAYVVCVEEGRILLCRIAPGYTNGFDGYWTLPGGGIDFGEDPREGAIRELAEETGLQGVLEGLLEVESNRNAFTSRSGAPVDFHGIRIIYRARITGGELLCEVGGSTDACQWFTPDELASENALDLAWLGVRLAFGETAR